jgi:peptide deformylase
MAERGYTCLAAIHIGIPLRIAVVGEEVLINPTIEHQGSSISRAYETSAFFPEREPVMVTRFTPVTLKFRDLGGERVETFRGVHAHCALHMLNQFEARGIY